MHEILQNLPPGSRVLDLGSGRGTFDAATFEGVVAIRVDLERPQAPPPEFIQADASRLPFAAGAFDAVICNHTLEHFVDLDLALKEIGRVIKASGALFVSVPDASTLADRVYRWLGKGGGHVNRITRSSEIAARVESATRLGAAGTRLLLTSYSFLNVNNGRARRMVRYSGLGQESFLVWLTWGLRKLDATFGTRTSVYGWALWFGAIRQAIDESTWANVCVRCGSAHPSGYLLRLGLTAKKRWLRRYRCPACGTSNIFLPDESMRHVQ